MGPHIGDLTNAETLRSYEEGIAHVGRLFGVEPEVVAHDLHPDYLSTAHALAREGVELVGVQHHHAHLAACLAEHGEHGPAVGAIFDGTGLGLDGTVWGGELLAGGLAGFERAGHLLPVRLPGGEQAVRQPWRMACAWLAAATGRRSRRCRGRWRGGSTRRAGGPSRGWRRAASPRRSRRARGGCATRSPPSAACAPRSATRGRRRSSWRPRPPRPTRAPTALSGRAGRRSARARPARDDPGACWPTSRRASPAAVIAARFHAALAEATAAACAEIARRRGLDTVVLSGGVFQNRRLLEGTAAALAGGRPARARPGAAAAQRRRHRLRPGRRRGGAWELAAARPTVSSSSAWGRRTRALTGARRSDPLTRGCPRTRSAPHRSERRLSTRPARPSGASRRACGSPARARAPTRAGRAAWPAGRGGGPPRAGAARRCQATSCVSKGPVRGDPQRRTASRPPAAAIAAGRSAARAISSRASRSWSRTRGTVCSAKGVAAASRTAATAAAAPAPRRSARARRSHAQPTPASTQTSADGSAT